MPTYACMCSLINCSETELFKTRSPKYHVLDHAVPAQIIIMTRPLSLVADQSLEVHCTLRIFEVHIICEIGPCRILELVLLPESYNMTQFRTLAENPSSIPNTVEAS